jgi:hypothetical protein
MSDIVERLRFGAERLECLPIDLGEVRSTVMTAAEYMRRAADELEHLRSLAGKADVGPSFAEIAKDLPRNEPISS